jgi:DNA-binding CsgD family transcriptional regulator
MFRGKLIDAVDSYCAATGRLTLADPMRALPVTQCWRAFAEAQAGMIRAAELSLERVEPESLPDEFRVDALRNRVSAWLMAQTGDLLGAATTARSAGRHLANHTHVVWGCLALHDAVRFGHADLVADELAALADQVDGLLIPTMALHARAMAGMEATGLEDVGHAFAGMGATLFAAEAAAQAATLHQLQGNQHAAGRASTRASNLAASCEGSDTPALRQRIRFLTSREEEIARLAARGLSSGEISDRLIISRRTVDNHLGSVYTKLGLHRREELADIISVA